MKKRLSVSKYYPHLKKYIHLCNVEAVQQAETIIFRELQKSPDTTCKLNEYTYSLKNKDTPYLVRGLDTVLEYYVDVLFCHHKDLAKDTFKNLSKDDYSHAYLEEIIDGKRKSDLCIYNGEPLWFSHNAIIKKTSLINPNMLAVKVKVGKKYLDTVLVMQGEFRHQGGILTWENYPSFPQGITHKLHHIEVVNVFLSKDEISVVGTHSLYRIPIDYKGQDRFDGKYTGKMRILWVNVDKVKQYKDIFSKMIQKAVKSTLKLY